MNEMVDHKSIASYVVVLSRTDLEPFRRMPGGTRTRWQIAVLLEVRPARGNCIAGESRSIQSCDGERLRYRGAMMRLEGHARGSSAQDIDASRLDSLAEIGVTRRASPETVGVTAVIHVDRVVLARGR